MTSQWYEELFTIISCPHVLQMKIDFRKYWYSPPQNLVFQYTNLNVWNNMSKNVLCWWGWCERNKATSCNLHKHFSIPCIGDISKIQSSVRDFCKKKLTIQGEKGWKFCGNSHYCNTCRAKSETGQSIEEFRSGNKLQPSKMKLGFLW